MEENLKEIEQSFKTQVKTNLILGGKRRDRVDRDRGDRYERDRGDRDRDRDRDRGDRDRGDGRFPRRIGPQPTDICYNCGESGHW